MATVEIENATVERIIDGYGFKATVEVPLKSGETKKERYTVWTKQPVREGDIVSIKGLLGVKMEEFTNQSGELVRYAAVHVNNALIEADAPF